MLRGSEERDLLVAALRTPLQYDLSLRPNGATGPDHRQRFAVEARRRRRARRCSRVQVLGPGPYSPSGVLSSVRPATKLLFVVKPAPDEFDACRQDLFPAADPPRRGPGARHRRCETLRPGACRGVSGARSRVPAALAGAQAPPPGPLKACSSCCSAASLASSSRCSCLYSRSSGACRPSRARPSVWTRGALALRRGVRRYARSGLMFLNRIPARDAAAAHRNDDLEYGSRRTPGGHRGVLKPCPVVAKSCLALAPLAAAAVAGNACPARVELGSTCLTAELWSFGSFGHASITLPGDGAGPTTLALDAVRSCRCRVCCVSADCRQPASATNTDAARSRCYAERRPAEAYGVLCYAAVWRP